MLHDPEFCFAGLIIIPPRRFGACSPNKLEFKCSVVANLLDQKCALVANGLFEYKNISLLHQMTLLLYFFTRTLATNFLFLVQHLLVK